MAKVPRTSIIPSIGEADLSPVTFTELSGKAHGRSLIQSPASIKESRVEEGDVNDPSLIDRAD